MPRRKKTKFKTMDILTEWEDEDDGEWYQEFMQIEIASPKEAPEFAFKHNRFWISPDGTWYGWSDVAHEHVIRGLAKEGLFDEEVDANLEAVDMGWFRVQTYNLKKLNEIDIELDNAEDQRNSLRKAFLYFPDEVIADVDQNSPYVNFEMPLGEFLGRARTHSRSRLDKPGMY